MRLGWGGGFLGAEVGYGLFVEQEGGGLHAAVGVEPALDYVVTEEIAHGEQAHALVMGHPGADDLAARPAEAATENGVVGGFVEAVGAEPSHGLHAAQVAQGSGGIDGERQEGGVG